MKPFLLIPVLALTVLTSFGCSIAEHPSIPASVPGGRFGQSNKVAQAGTYAVYRVTQWDMWGAPVNAEKVISVDVQANDRVGFDFVMPKEKQYSPDAQSDVVAYAGSRRINLGPLVGIDEHYFWANPNDWDGYWLGAPNGSSPGASRCIDRIDRSNVVRQTNKQARRPGQSNLGCRAYLLKRHRPLSGVGTMMGIAVKVDIQRVVAVGFDWLIVQQAHVVKVFHPFIGGQGFQF